MIMNKTRYYKKIIENGSYVKILNEIKNNRHKVNHWMYWVFPQKYGVWGSHNVSDLTIEYSIKNDEEVIFFLSNRKIRTFYCKAIGYLLSKMNNKFVVNKIMGVLHSFFGPIDLVKFKSHLLLFQPICELLSKDYTELKRTNDIINMFINAYKISSHALVHIKSSKSDMTIINKYLFNHHDYG